MQPDMPAAVILASSSRYRRELLSRLNIPFETESPSIDESPRADESPKETSIRLAREKAKAVGKNHPNTIIIGSDQVAECNGTPIGKPLSFERAMDQLRFMRGKEVLFHTALCVLDGKNGEALQETVITTTVAFRNLPDEELASYLMIEKPFDCAGSAKNEGLGITLLEKIESNDPTALTGLPLIALTSMLRNCGITFFAGGK
ncbi:MAG: septum formation protein Maf [Oxalobacter sp.]|nr:septum formation protein Maf [Oxalobacter sp.]